MKQTGVIVKGPKLKVLIMIQNLYSGLLISRTVTKWICFQLPSFGLICYSNHRRQSETWRRRAAARGGRKSV